MRASRDHRRHAVRVAGIATLVVMACYLVAAILLNLIVTHHLVGNIDTRLAERLHDAAQQTLTLPGGSDVPANEGDVDDAPVFLWSVTSSGAVTPLRPGSPSLPHRAWGGGPVTVRDGTSTFRFNTARAHGGELDRYQR